jgi:hypothetical protein
MKKITITAFLSCIAAVALFVGNLETIYNWYEKVFIAPAVERAIAPLDHDIRFTKSVISQSISDKVYSAKYRKFIIDNGERPK